MNVKKSLEKKIRGWFPKEPNLPSFQRTTNLGTPPSYRIEDTSEASPYFLSLLLPLVLIFNIFLPLYDLVIQHFIRGFPPPIHGRLDLWIISRYFGNNDYSSGYTAVIVAVYFLSLLVGLATSWGTLGPIFSKLFKNNEVTMSMRSFVARGVLDIPVGILIITFAFDPILEYIVQYPTMINAQAAGSSAISFYAFSGFILGAAAMKAFLPFTVFVKNRRQHLTLLTQNIYSGTKAISKRPYAIRWAFVPNEQTLTNPEKAKNLASNDG